jgi:hypothetical protein
MPHDSTRKPRTNALQLLTLLLPLSLAGCGKPGPVAVSGTVTHNHQPVADVFIMFESEEGGAAWANSDTNGRFELTTAERKGVLPGTYRVWVQYQPMEPDPNAPADSFAPPEWMATLTTKYGRETSELKVQIAGPRDDLTLQLD